MHYNGNFWFLQTPRQILKCWKEYTLEIATKCVFYKSNMILTGKVNDLTHRHGNWQDDEKGACATKGTTERILIRDQINNISVWNISSHFLQISAIAPWNSLVIFTVTQVSKIFKQHKLCLCNGHDIHTWTKFWLCKFILAPGKLSSV